VRNIGGLRSSTAAVSTSSAEGEAGELCERRLAIAEDKRPVGSKGLETAARVLVVVASRGPTKTTETINTAEASHASRLQSWKPSRTTCFPSSALLVVCYREDLVLVAQSGARPARRPESGLPERRRLLAVLGKLTPVVLTRPSKSGIITCDEQQRCT
jgi:hypothetical protein